MLQHISKTVNLDEMISRFPGMLYAIQEKTDEYGISYYDYDTVSGFTGGDYGRIVNDIELPEEIVNILSAETDIYINIPVPSDDSHKTDIKYYGEFYTIGESTQNSIDRLTSNLKKGESLNYYYIKDNDIYSYNRKITSASNITDVILDSTKHKYLTFKTAQNWYEFFNSYKEMTTAYRFKTIRYDNYSGYVEGEYGTGSIITGSTADNVFSARGGDVMYSWLKENIFKEYETKIQDAGNKLIYHQIEGKHVPYFMTYPQILEWKKWFKQYGDNYGFYQKTCSEVANENYISSNQLLSNLSVESIGCMFKEWTEKGGDTMYEWLSSIKNYTDYPKQLKSATITLPVFINNSIYNLGEETLLSDEWVGGKKYTEGEIFSIEDTCYQLSGNGGSSFNKCLYENSPSDVINRNDIYSGCFATNLLYSFNENGEYIVSPSRYRMGIKCPIVYGNVFYIGNVIYNVINTQYIIFTNTYGIEMYFRVFYSGDKRPYCIINGNAYYGHDGYIYMYGNDCDEYNSKYKIYDKSDFIYFKEHYIKVDDNGQIVLNVMNTGDETLDESLSSTYDEYDGYFEYGNKFYFIKNGELSNNDNDWVLLIKQSMKAPATLTEDSYFIDSDNKIAYVIKKYTVYDISVGSGTTESKLDTFMIKETIHDLAGNTIYGMKKDSASTLPNEGEIMGIPFKKKYAFDTEKTDEVYSLGGYRNYLFGDILTDIKYKYLISGDTYEDIEDENKIYEMSTWESGYTLYADFYYVMGGIIKLTGDSEYNYEWIGNIESESANPNYKKGIIFKETRELELLPQRFCLCPIKSKNLKNTSRFIDYEIIYYINIKDNPQSIGTDSITNETVTANLASFTYYKELSKTDDGKYYFKLDDGYTNSPTFRREFNIGNIGPKTVKSSIYMDRGNASSLARHFALGECKSLESLVQYQNGALTIMNNEG